MARLSEMGLQRRVLSGEQVREVYDLRQKYLKPSIPDLMALTLAKCENGMLLTGDRELRRVARTEGVDCRGTLWLLDALVASGTITPSEAAKALSSMLSSGRRLPEIECKIRLEKWKPQAG